MLQQAGIQVGVIYPEIRPLKGFEWELLRKNYFQTKNGIENGIPTVRMHGWNLFPKFLEGTQWQWKQAAFRLFENYIAQYGKPDLLHAQSALWGGVAANFLSKHFSIPYIISEHRDNFLYETLNLGSKQTWINPLLKTAFSTAANVTTVSNFLKKGVLRYVDRVEVIPNFVDTDRFTPQKKDRKDFFTFLTVGNLVASKNIDLLLDAYAMMRAEMNNVLLQIIGDGPERKALENKAIRLGVPVQFMGSIMRDQIRNLYGKADAFVLPSQVETFGIVFVEAMAMGLPSIGVKGGGPQEILENGGGILIDKPNPQLLKDAMLQLYNTRQQFDPQALHHQAKCCYGKEAVIKKWIDIYSCFC